MSIRENDGREMANQPHLIFTLMRYICVGVSVALVYLVTFAALERVHLAPTAVNSAIAFICAVIFQYVAQGAFTFRQPLNDAKQMMRFITTVTFGLIISSVIVGYVGPALGVSNFVASLLVVVLLPVFNLVAFMLWVFVDKAEKTK